MSDTIPAEPIERKIFALRGQRVILDADLAVLYDVPLKALKQAVRRNRTRFPGDFLFEVSREEARSLRSQTVTLDILRPTSARGRHSKYESFAFTEQGVAMLASVLRSSRAIEVNIGIVRTFVRLRRLAMDHAEFARRLAELERTTATHDKRIRAIFSTLRRLMTPDEQETTPDKPAVGFR